MVHQEEDVYNKGNEALAQAAQNTGGCIIPGSAQSQIGWGHGQHNLVEAVSAHSL